jgi:prefoldin subunit 2
MINGVLVERTVKDVIPALQTNAEGLKKVLDDLVKNYKSKQDELETWKVRHDCHTSRQQSPGGPNLPISFTEEE